MVYDVHRYYRLEQTMQTFHATLGGQPVEIKAPRAGEFDPVAFHAEFPSGGLYGLDTESTAFTKLAQWEPDFKLRLVQVATADTAWVLDMSDVHQQLAARNVLTDEANTFTSHNNVDVLNAAVRLDADITRRNLDTLVLASMAYTDRMAGRDLKTLTTELIGPELADADAALAQRFRDIWPGRKNAAKADVEEYGWKTIPADDPTYLTYAGLDAIAARRIVEKLVPLTGAPAKLIETEMWLAGEANRLQLRGALVDIPMLDEVDAETTGVVEEAEARMKELCGIGPRQSAKLIEWFGQHGADWDRWESFGGDLTKTGNVSLAKDNAKLLERFELDEVGAAVREHFLTYKGWADRSLKVKAVREHLAPDGRVHSTLKTIGAAATARMSSTDPNMQNFSKKDPRTRGMFIPRPGHVLISCDFDQVELRVVAALAGEQVMINAILAGEDLHQLSADGIGRPDRRDLGKMSNFLIVYGGGGNALASQARIDLEDARNVVRAWRDNYPAIAALDARMKRFTHHIRTVSGRRLEVGKTPDGGTRAYANINYLVQSSARDLLVDAWHRFATVYGRADMVWMPIHDELVLEVPEELVDQVSREIEECMTFDFMGVPITATAAVLRDEKGVSRWGK